MASSQQYRVTGIATPAPGAFALTIGLTRDWIDNALYVTRDAGVTYWGLDAVHIPGTGRVWTFQNLKYMSGLHHFKYTWETTGWGDAGNLVVMWAIHNTLGHKV